MSKFLQRVLVLGAAVLMPLALLADENYQLPDSHFEDWSGTAFDGNAQPKYWHGSNVSQTALGMTFNFNFTHRETGRGGSGYCVMVKDQEVGAAGITEVGPGYFSLGTGWQYLDGLDTKTATAGTYGGYNFSYRPDSVSVWIKRTGNNTDKEDFHVLFYSWSGTAKGSQYKNKNNGCTSVSITDEESDIRVALDKNECKLDVQGDQVAEGWLRDRQYYGDWVNVRIPIYYMNNNAPKKCNLIFSASNYPNFRANNGLYVDNALYVDDVELIYSSKIQKLFVGEKEWKGFDPNSEEVQVYSLGETATEVPTIEAIRGAGSLTNTKNQTANFPGRTLSGKEITINYGKIDEITTITVKAEDGSSTHTYRIKFQRAASSNAKLASISYVLGDMKTAIPNFKPANYNYTVELPYGTKTVPTIVAEGQEDQQKIEITQPTSLTGQATIKVTAANGTSTATYTLSFKVGLLADNTLKDILINGKSLPGFTPTQAVYKVSLPVSTTSMPTVEAVSAYDEGEQTIVHEVPDIIDGGQYKISVTTPGNTVAKVYKLNFKLEASSYTYLKGLQLEGDQVLKVAPATLEDSTKFDFAPENLTYYATLKMGTKTLPERVITPGDEYQKIVIDSLKGLDGTERITVTAGNGNQSVYKVVFTTLKSSNSLLSNILIGGEPIEGFRSDSTYYTYFLPVGTTELPTIEAVLGDQYQDTVITRAGVNGKTRIAVTAGDGSTTIYQIAFSVATYTNNTLKALYLDGVLIDGFDPKTNEYTVNLPQGTTALPKVTYDLQDENFQSVSVRTITGLNGDYKITVRPASGSSRTYIIHFSVAMSNNSALKMIYLNKDSLKGFHPDTLHYIDSLPVGQSAIPTVTYDKAEAIQRVVSVLEGRTQKITVAAENRDSTRTYEIQFILQVSANTQLKMIYLNGDSLAGFDSKEPNYKLKMTTETCPLITVDKEPGQQVTITAPYAEGVALIKVKSETGDEQTYTITFEKEKAASVRLDGIKIDGVAIPDFKADSTEYTAQYSTVRPTIEAVKHDPSQMVQVAWKEDVAWIYVQDSLKNQNAYKIEFTRLYSSVDTLKAILLDGTPMAEFVAATKNYTRNLSAGSTYPKVGYIKGNEQQTVSCGQVADGKYAIFVTSERGDTTTYTVQFNIAKFDDVTLSDLEVDGYTITFDSAQAVYSGLVIDEGEELPKVTATAKEGQSVITFNENDSTQRVLIMTQSGDTSSYTIKYARKKSDNAKLKNILIDGQPLFGFQPDILNYTYSLPRATKVVPNVNPIAGLENQTITTYFGRPNDTTKIKVQPQEGAARWYSIYFPVEKSDDTVLDSLLFDGAEQDVNKTTYTFDVAFGTVELPFKVEYKAKPGQLVKFTDAPISEATQITVTNEKGDNSRTYTISFNMLQPEGVNEVKSVTCKWRLANDTEETKTFKPVPGENVVDVPFGTKDFNVTAVDTTFRDQTIAFYNGGIRRGAKIIASSNREGEKDVVYTIVPNILPDTIGKLKSLTFKGVTVPKFRPDVYNYIVNVTGDTEPVQDDFEGVAFGGLTVAKSDIDSKKKQIKLTVKDVTNTYKTYSICWFYQDDKDPFDFRATWVKAGTTGFKPSSDWRVMADYTAGHLYEIANYKIPYTSGKEVSRNGENGALLSTMRQGALCSSIPGMMALSEFSIHLEDGGTTITDWSIHGKSTTSISQNPSDGITFRNTPEQLRFEYNAVQSSSDINAWSIKLFIGDGSTHELSTFPGNYDNKNQFTPDALDITYPNGIITNKLNAILNSCGTEQANDMNKLSANQYSDLILQNMHLTYNSAFTAGYMNGETMDLDNATHTFTYTVPANQSIIGLPELTFTGAVHDQTQTIEWLNNGEWINGQLKAKVVNYGENANEELRDSTIYTVIISRPAETSVDFEAFRDGATVPLELSDVSDTTVVMMNYGTKKLPSLTIAPNSTNQIVSMTKDGNAYTVHVVAEDGAESTKVIIFQEEKKSDAVLESWDFVGSATKKTIDGDHYIFGVEKDEIPVIAYEKKPGQYQKVDITYTRDSVIMLVTAEDGVTQIPYIIRRIDTVVISNGQIEQFTEGITPVSEFGADKYSKDNYKPAEQITFKRKFDCDSVVYIQTPDSLEWQVYGTENHTYTVHYPVVKSNNALLKDILIDGVHYSEFIPGATSGSYELESETLHIIEAVADEASQTLTTTQSMQGDTIFYQTTVTAEDGLAKGIYKLQIYRPKSDINTLADILLDSVPLTGFNPAITDYEVILPVPAVKVEEPKMPSITYITGHEGQTVTMEIGQVNGDSTVLSVMSEKGSTQVYTIFFKSAKSACVNLTGITIGGETLDGFEPGRHYYSHELPTNTISVDYTTDDRFQTITSRIDTIKPDRQYIYNLIVKAENGDSAVYEITLYVENQSNDAQLANITLDGQDFIDFRRDINPDVEAFDGGQNSYGFNLPSGTTILPEVQALLKMEGQDVQIEHRSNDSILLHVTAADSTTVNTYTLNFTVPLSTNADLSMIFLNGDSITKAPYNADFRPDETVYQIDLPVGDHELPEVTGQQGEATQKVSEAVIDTAKLQATITVQAEDTTVRANSYVVIFHFTLSDADTLNVIYANGDTLEGFAPNKKYYTCYLPVGSTEFPSLDFELADEWQTARLDTVESSESKLIRQIEVVSESGKKNTYTISYEIIKSAVNTLEMIYIDQKQLEGFQKEKEEYYLTLSAEYAASLNGALPLVEYATGDERQTVEIQQVNDSLSGKTLGLRTQIIVTAENGTNRYYTIHYRVELSTDTRLNMIMVGGKPLTNFDSERFNYKEELATDAMVPVVSFVKKENAQVGNLIVDEDTVYIYVTAEDTTKVGTYKLIFERKLSDNTQLNGITLRDDAGEEFPWTLFPFRSNVYTYEIDIPYDPEDDDLVPTIEIDFKEVGQTADTVHHILPNGNIQVDITVTAVNGEDQAIYSLIFHPVKNNDATLKGILVKDQPIGDFDPSDTEYDFAHPYGSTEADFYGAEDITPVLSDTLATYTVTASEDGTLFIEVVAQDGSSLTYIIRQTIAKDNDCSLRMIKVDGLDLRDFDSNVTFYTYYLMEGDVVPLIEPEANSENAEVTFREVAAGDTCRILVTAQDGSERRYFIHFAISQMNGSLTPTVNDVLIKRIPGSYQMLVASLRQDVYFALYDQFGHLLMHQQVPMANPNDINVVNDPNYAEQRLIDIYNERSGLIVDIEPGKIYFYSFYQGDDKTIIQMLKGAKEPKIKSGKFMAQ